jgi:3-deoxy-D-manno-octulosonic-acid transferase
MKLFVKGRKQVFQLLEEKISPKDRVIWIHAASLGEYEQAVPVIKELRVLFAEHKILVTFFSPSGYEIKKNSPLADVVTYLPLDTAANASRFLELARPDLALFIKYEFWPNYLDQLQKRGIRTLLISGIFREDQLFFKSYGGWMRSYLKTFEHFFVQDKQSMQRLKSIGLTNVSLSGDTRFDRVTAQLQQDNRLDFMNTFLEDEICVVAGSTWPEDEELLLNSINETAGNKVKYVIAPHTIKENKIQQLQKSLKVSYVRYSEMTENDLLTAKVLIVDTIGLLGRIYSYADIAYVGGAAGGTGLHNILEPATFGVPIIIGKDFERFPEASELQALGGLFSVATKEDTYKILKKLIDREDFRRKSGKISREYIKNGKGAVNVIKEYLISHSK